MACKKLLAVDRSSSRTAFCRGSRCLFTVVTCQIKTFTLRGGWILKLKACAYGVMCLCKTRTIRSEIGAELACAASECLVHTEQPAEQFFFARLEPQKIQKLLQNEVLLSYVSLIFELFKCLPCCMCLAYFSHT